MSGTGGGGGTGGTGGTGGGRERTSGASEMRAMRCHGDGGALRFERVPRPRPGPDQVLVRVSACGVCRTDLHLLDGDLGYPVLPIVPGHEIVGRIEAQGAGVRGWRLGDRVGIPWLASTCGACRFCASGRENLCESARFTGLQQDGGYAEFALAESASCLPIPDAYSDVEAAPLLCAGLIGYRAYRLAGPGERLGLYGFGAAAHLIAQVALAQGRRVFAFTRPGDEAAQQFARELGAEFAGGSDESPPEPLDAAILFAPVGALVPKALADVDRGGRVVCAGIHMSEIPAFPYRILWQERTLCSVANLTREDGRAFMVLAPTIPVRCAVERFPLASANDALRRLRDGELRGAAVLEVGSGDATSPGRGGQSLQPESARALSRSGR